MKSRRPCAGRDLFESLAFLPLAGPCLRSGDEGVAQ